MKNDRPRSNEAAQAIHRTLGIAPARGKRRSGDMPPGASFDTLIASALSRLPRDDLFPPAPVLEWIMGLFLSLSGDVSAGLEEVEHRLRNYAEDNDGWLRRAALTREDDECLTIATGEGGATVLYPGDFFDWDDASRFLSVELGKPVFSLHIHDGDLWMYVLCERGMVVDQFNPVPDYWEELDDEERAKWRGDANVVARASPGSRGTGSPPTSSNGRRSGWSLETRRWRIRRTSIRARATGRCSTSCGHLGCRARISSMGRETVRRTSSVASGVRTEDRVGTVEHPIGLRVDEGPWSAFRLRKRPEQFERGVNRGQLPEVPGGDENA